MGRIKNKKLYPLDNSLNEDDYLIGSNIDNFGETRNYSIIAIARFVQDFLLNNGISLSDILIFNTAQEAYDNLGSHKYFRWAENNLDGVPSPKNTQIGITKN